MDYKKAAEKVFKTIKEEIAAQKKANKDRTVKKQLCVYLEWNSKTTTYYDQSAKCYKNGPTVYEIAVERNTVVRDIPSYRIMSYIFEEVCDMLDKQKKVKGWATVNYQTEGFKPVSLGLYADPVTVITKVNMPEPSCKEYNALRNYLNRYGVITDGWGSVGKLALNTFELFSVRSGGKRGVLWGEEGVRRYLDNKPEKCSTVLEQLRKVKGTKDIIVCRRGHEDYIDEMERRYSQYHETECDGEIREYLDIVVKTPTGKVKYEERVY